MKELLKALYDTFYEKQPAASLKAEVEECHQKLIERLGKPEHRLVLIAKTKSPRTCPLTASSPVSVWQCG